MGTKQENTVKRGEHAAKTAAQLKAWTTQADDLVVSYLAAGAGENDPYHIRIDELRTRLGVVQTKLNEYNDLPGNGGAWGTFQASIKDDWTTLENGFKDLTH